MPLKLVLSIISTVQWYMELIQLTFGRSAYPSKPVHQILFS